MEFGAEPNTHTCPICLGLPGALPVMNHEALRLTVLTGLMLGCDIAPVSKFDRKNYFYPDMPKNYQISQYDMPLCTNGSVPLHDLAYPKDAQKNIVTPDKEVHLVRIHLEEDVAKSFHFEKQHRHRFQPRRHAVDGDRDPAGDQFAGGSVRVPHVAQTDPDLRRGERCRYGERDNSVAIAMFRCARKPQPELGAKIEIKNMNSISGVRRALAYEIRSGRSHRSSAAKNSSRKRAAGMMPRAKRFSCGPRNSRTIIVIFPIRIWCR